MPSKVTCFADDTKVLKKVKSQQEKQTNLNCRHPQLLGRTQWVDVQQFQI